MKLTRRRLAFLVATALVVLVAAAVLFDAMSFSPIKHPDRIYGMTKQDVEAMLGTPDSKTGGSVTEEISYWNLYDGDILVTFDEHGKVRFVKTWQEDPVGRLLYRLFRWL